MSLVHLGHIRLGDRIFHQYIDTDTDETHFDEGRVTGKRPEVYPFTVDHDGYLYHRDKRIGKFGYFGDNDWGYTHHNGAKIVNLGKELIEGERIVINHIVSSGEYES